MNQIVSEAWFFLKVELIKAILKWYILSVRAPAKWVFSSDQRLKIRETTLHVLGNLKSDFVVANLGGVRL